MSTAKRVIDWERVESLFRAGVMSVREIAAEFGISHTAINKRAKAEDWSRDLAAKVKAKADALVSKALVSTEVSKERKVSEAMVVEVEATVQARIRISHRADIGRSRTLTMKLLEELESQTSLVPELNQLADLLHAPDKNGMDKLNELYRKVISLPGRTKTMKDLGDTLRILIGLEREAFGLKSVEETDKKPLDRLPDAELSDRLAEFMARLGK